MLRLRSGPNRYLLLLEHERLLHHSQPGVRQWVLEERADAGVVWYLRRFWQWGWQTAITKVPFALFVNLDGSSFYSEFRWFTSCTLALWPGLRTWIERWRRIDLKKFFLKNLDISNDWTVRRKLNRNVKVKRSLLRKPWYFNWLDNLEESSLPGRLSNRDFHFKIHLNFKSWSLSISHHRHHHHNYYK